MYVFVIHTGDGAVFPPHGLRVSTHDTMKELVAELIEFFGEAEDQAVYQLDWYPNGGQGYRGLEHVLERLTHGRPWSIYSPETGYFPF